MQTTHNAQGIALFLARRMQGRNANINSHSGIGYFLQHVDTEGETQYKLIQHTCTCLLPGTGQVQVGLPRRAGKKIRKESRKHDTIGYSKYTKFRHFTIFDISAAIYFQRGVEGMVQCDRCNFIGVLI